MAHCSEQFNGEQFQSGHTWLVNTQNKHDIFSHLSVINCPLQPQTCLSDKWDFRPVGSCWNAVGIMGCCLQWEFPGSRIEHLGWLQFSVYIIYFFLMVLHLKLQWLLVSSMLLFRTSILYKWRSSRALVDSTKTRNRCPGTLHCTRNQPATCETEIA